MYLLLIAIVTLYVLYSWIATKPRNFPPGPPTVPILGSTPFLPKQNLHFHMEKWKKEYGGVVGLVMGRQLAVAVSNPKLVREILKRDEFQGRPVNATLEDISFGRRIGIMFNDGQQWQEQRRFTIRHLKDLGLGKTSMEGVMIEEVSEVIEDIRDRTKQVTGLFNLSAVNVLWAVTAGIRYQHNDPRLGTLMDQLTAVFREGSQFGDLLLQFPILRHVVPDKYNHRKKVVNDMQRMFAEAIKEHKQTLDGNSPRDFMDVYLSEMNRQGPNSSFDEQTLITTCSELFSAGAESVSNSIGFALLYMVLHPDVQEKVHAEIDKVIGSSRKPSLLDKSSLPFVEAVLLEIQRCNTIAPLTVIHRTTEETTIDKYTIPKNTFTFLSLWSIMQDEERWGDPENFRPSRFIQENGTIIKDNTIIPFGIGKRQCPGEALARNILFLFFTSLMQEFNVALPHGHQQPSTVCLSGFTTAPQRFEITFKSRK